MTTKSELAINRTRERITRIRESLDSVDYLCSGTLQKRMMKCGKLTCRCAKDPEARHGPYYEWGHMVAGKLVHRMVPPEQAAKLQLGIENYRKMKKLILAWEKETEKLIALEAPRTPRT
jgi:hypothetical protein